MNNKHPMQPVEWDGKGVIRFKSNRIVRFLLNRCEQRGCGLNELGLMDFSDEDFEQLAQLIGYSVSAGGSLSYFSKSATRRADNAVERLIRVQPKDPGLKR